MEFRVRWPTKLTPRDELKPGDLFVIYGPGTHLLALRIGGKAQESAIVLAEWGDRTGASLPEVAALAIILDQVETVRVIEEGLVLEPGSETVDSVLGLDAPGAIPAGALAEMDDGRLGIFVRRQGISSAIYDLRTGEDAPRPHVRRYRNWRLSWFDGDDRIELAGFGLA
ncbi:MAG: hypothetical protein ACREEB_18495 [Caulobacteraceae bacterium]